MSNNDNIGHLTRANLDRAIADLRHKVQTAPVSAAEIAIPVRPEIEAEMKRREWVDQSGNLTTEGWRGLFCGGSF